MMQAFAGGADAQMRSAFKAWGQKGFMGGGACDPTMYLNPDTRSCTMPHSAGLCNMVRCVAKSLHSLLVVTSEEERFVTGAGPAYN